MQTETLQLERLVDDPEIGRAAARTLKGFCLTYLSHHFPADLSDFFDEMCGALQDYDITGGTPMASWRGSRTPDCSRCTVLEFPLLRDGDGTEIERCA
jgi:hypothetical protein